MVIRIDCDSHFAPDDRFDDVDPRFGRRRPRQWSDAAGRSIVRYPEREANLTAHQRYVYRCFDWSRPNPGLSDPELRIQFLDQVGADMQVLVPDSDPYHYDVEPELATSVCQSYNNAVSRVLKKYPGRFLGLAVLPMQDPDRAVQELDRAVGELGLHAPVVCTNVDGRDLDEPEFWPVFAKIEELGVPLILHPSRSGKMLGIERLRRFHLHNTLGCLYEGAIAMTSLILGGVLDLFPRLRVALLETWCGYLPHLMDRLQAEYEHGADKLIRKPPYQYADQFWLCANVSMEKEELVHVVQRYGADRLIMGTDFPHGLGEGIGVTGAGPISDYVEAIPGLTNEQKDRILGLNAAELFGITTP